MTQETSIPQGRVLVACLCAEWCGVCRDYRARFEQLQSLHPQAMFRWIDVEDEADLLHPLDVENFPTVLLAVGDEPRFFGTLMPQIEALDRMIRAAVRDDANQPCASADVVDLLGRIRRALAPT